MSKKQANPLLGPGVSNFKLEDSFGIQPTLIVPAPSLTPSSESKSLFSDTATGAADPFSDVNLNSNSPVKPESNLPAPPPVMSLGPPQPGLFLLPGSGPSPPPITPTVPKPPRSRYVPPPGIHASSSSGNLPAMMEHSTPIQPPPASAGMFMMPTASPIMPASSSVPDFSSAIHPNAPELYPGQFQYKTVSTPTEPPPAVVMPDEPLYHWYYKVLEKSYNVLNPT